MAKTRKNKKQTLGKGLRALLEGINTEHVQTPKAESNKIAPIPIHQIEVNPYQPREKFDETALQELATSIKTHGIIQPITVRSLGVGKYQLIAGERRLRASKLAKLKQIPAYIRTADDQAMLEIALIENIQREDLNAMEIAQNYQRLIEECTLTHEDLAKRLGKTRTTISNYLRLLKLPPEIQLALKSKKLSMGHARALIAIDKVEVQLMLFQNIVEQGWSVRKVEDWVRQYKNQNKKTPKKKKTATRLPPEIQQLQDDLARRLDTQVRFTRTRKGKGQLSISFASDADLNRILELIGGE